VAPGRVQVTFDCADPAALATFWAGLVGYPPPEHGTNEDGGRWSRIADSTGARPRLFFQQVPEPKVVKNRVHLDVAAPAEGPGDRRQQIDAEVNRVVGLGASRLRSVTDEVGYFVVMQDPEGNEFCID
jgi:hypothetical protein